MTLLALDFDGTLSTSDMTVLLGREYDVQHEIRGLAEQGLRGEVDYATTLRQRVSLLEGMPEDRVEAAFDRGKLRDGAAEVLTALNRSEVSVAIITGSFERGVETILENAGAAVDHVIANRLVLEKEAVTGVNGPLVDGQKDAALEELASTEGIDLDRTIAVGNGATDLPMLRVAGSAVGFEPVPVVEQYCDVVVTSIRRLRLYLEQHEVIETPRRE